MNQLRGTLHGRIDEKGRIKVPATFRQQIEERFGRELYITSEDGRSILIYPMVVWEEFENKLAKLAKTDPSRSAMERWTRFYGGVTELDNQGRALVPQLLRSSVGHEGEVVVMGYDDHLLAATEERMRQLLEETPVTREVLSDLAAKGV
jgi:MraZ protein